MSNQTDDLEFAPDHDQPIAYLTRIRTYYQALGYDTPYRWAHYNDVPFTPLAKPLAQSRVAIITTAAPYQADKGDQGPGAPYNAAAKFYRVYAQPVNRDVDVRISHLGIDRKHTTAQDMNTWLPLAAMGEAVDQGRIGGLAENLYGLPTNRSQRTTIEQDCTDLLAALRKDGADAAVLAAN